MDNTENATALSPSEATKPSSPLVIALDTHQNSHARLSELFSVLERRLSLVLRPDEPADQATEKADLPVQSDLVSALQGSNNRLKSYERRLGSILNRLEI